MTAPTRRQLIVAGLAAAGAAGTPGIATGADPDERLRLAVRELQGAVQARFPAAEIVLQDYLEPVPDAHPVLFVAVRQPS